MKRRAVKAAARLTRCYMATALIITLGAVLAGATGTHAKTLHVDDDGVQDKKAQYRSIQAAVDAAQTGDVIKVAPGLYKVAPGLHLGSPEKYKASLSIRTSGLKLIGAQSGNHDTTRMTFTPDPTKESIIVAAPDQSASVIIRASEVTLDGFFLANGQVITINAGEDPRVIPPKPLSGVRIENNVVRMKKSTTPQDSEPAIVLQDLTSSTISNNIIFAALDETFGSWGIMLTFFSSDVSITGNMFYNVYNQIMVTGLFRRYPPGTDPTRAATTSPPFDIKIP